ncbi:unnamed protein product [Citrullus colocynthis]|uniref:Uncharacterized protein n=1 Tax=Citrullus colocynthis TaxID=252529 RepID=A0ABP0YD20_9ROSI
MQIILHSYGAIVKENIHKDIVVLYPINWTLGRPDSSPSVLTPLSTAAYSDRVCNQAQCSKSAELKSQSKLMTE